MPSKKQANQPWYRFSERLHSISEYLEAVDFISKRLTKNMDEELDPWFRGVSDANHSLIPGLYRLELQIDKLDENSFRDDFLHKAPLLLQDYKPQSDWDWYFIMQHYGLPTRLLDWTEGSLLALYFALYPRPASVATNTAQKTRAVIPPSHKVNATASDSAVWILDPWHFNKRVAKRDDVIYSATQREVSKYLPQVWSGDPLPPAPVAIQPTFNSRRIIAQRGMFTIHGQSHRGLEQYPAMKNHLWRLDIAQESVNAMRSELWRCGITESTIFPELAGLCREIKDFWTYTD